MKLRYQRWLRVELDWVVVGHLRGGGNGLRGATVVEDERQCEQRDEDDWDHSCDGDQRVVGGAGGRWGRSGWGWTGSCRRCGRKVAAAPQDGNRGRVDARVDGADYGAGAVVGPGNGHGRVPRAASDQLVGRLLLKREATICRAMGQREVRWSEGGGHHT